MIGEILNAVLSECTALLDGTGASVLLKTNFKLKDGLTNSMPLVLLVVKSQKNSKPGENILKPFASKIRYIGIL